MNAKNKKLKKKTTREYPPFAHPEILANADSLAVANVAVDSLLCSFQDALIEKQVVAQLPKRNVDFTIQ